MKQLVKKWVKKQVAGEIIDKVLSHKNDSMLEERIVALERSIKLLEKDAHPPVKNLLERLELLEKINATKV